MSQNPLAVLAAMLGGGFQGYGQAQQRKADNADRDRRFGLDYEQFKDQSGLNRDRFGLDQELGRGSLGVQQGNLDLGNRELKHRTNIDFARLFSDDYNADQNRNNATNIARIGAFGRPDREDAERERWGMAWLSANKGNPEAMKAIQTVFQGAPELAKRPGLAGYYAQVALANQGRMENVDARTNATNARAQGGRGGVMPSFGSTAPIQPQGAPQVAPPPAKPRTAAEWDAAAAALMKENPNITDQEIVNKLGPAPLQ